MARILVLDDDPSVLALERILLSEEGHEVLIVPTGRAGIEMLKLYQVDLIIVDIMMPELNGFQFVNLIRNNPKIQQTPIAFLTARSDRQDIIRAGEIGADFYIMKPIVPDRYIKKVSEFFIKNPPKEHSRVIFQNPMPAEIKTSINGMVCSVSDVGVEILTEASVDVDQMVELTTSLFYEIPLKNPLMSVASVKSELTGLRRVQLTFLELDREAVLKIQRWISYNKLKKRKEAS